MDEVKFVLKGLAFAVVFTMLLQFSVGGETLEMRSDRLLHHSSVGRFLNQTAEGAVALIRKGSHTVSGMMGSSEKENRHQRAYDSSDADDSPDKE